MARIMVRRGTSAKWSAKNPILEEGEPGYDTETHELKIGDGSSNWSDLEGIAVASLINIDAMIDARLQALGLIL